jgi:hypothetical protein
MPSTASRARATQTQGNGLLAVPPVPVFWVVNVMPALGAAAFPVGSIEYTL